MSIKFADLFCGAGGSSTGLEEAGWELVAAANHSKVAIETHAANHPGAEHLCVDISAYDMRHLPAADVLWASPICTEISPAGGRARARRGLGQGPLPFEEHGSIEPGAWERTRATAWDVLRAAETWRYKAILVENVVEFATDWDLFEVWLAALDRLGYAVQIASLNSAHLANPGNLAAPQWRDRIYIVAVRKGMRRPDLAPRPEAWCEHCGAIVAAVQTWRGSRRIGKYARQYDYRCPACKCLVEPYVRPASSVIDWSNLGTRIGDRARPLATATMARIHAGLARYPTVPVDAAPTNPYIVTLRGGAKPSSVNNPLGAVCASGNRQSLVVPGGDAFVVTLRRNGGATAVTEPVSTVSAGGNHHGLVIPYRKGIAKPASDPMLTLASRDSAGLLRPALDVEDCRFRMIQPREQLSAQRFPRGYVVHGTKGEQTMQAGNAVSVNAAAWLGTRLAAVI